eukprot:5456801-Amphidinium_carterae.1
MTPPNRASRNAALDSIRTEDRAEASVKSLRNDFYANSSRASAASLLNTWQELATTASRGAPIWPLSAELLERVAVAFKSGDYRSFPNYVYKAKQVHIERGHPWTD